MTKKLPGRTILPIMTLGQLLAAWRIGMGITHTEAARRAGLSISNWWEIEKDKRSDLRLSTFEKLSVLTGYDVDRLMMAAALSRKHRLESRSVALPA